METLWVYVVLTAYLLLNLEVEPPCLELLNTIPWMFAEVMSTGAILRPGRVVQLSVNLTLGLEWELTTSLELRSTVRLPRHR